MQACGKGYGHCSVLAGSGKQAANRQHLASVWQMHTLVLRHTVPPTPLLAQVLEKDVHTKKCGGLVNEHTVQLVRTHRDPTTGRPDFKLIVKPRCSTSSTSSSTSSSSNKSSPADVSISAWCPSILLRN
jgi:hypothetical protein